MKFSLVLMAILGCLAVTGFADNIQGGSRLLCYYDSTAFIREGEK